MLERSWKEPFQLYITSPHNFKIAVGKPKKQICSRLVTADHGGQKNCNGKMTAVLFYHVFLLVIIQKSNSLKMIVPNLSFAIGGWGIVMQYIINVGRFKLTLWKERKIIIIIIISTYDDQWCIWYLFILSRGSTRRKLVHHHNHSLQPRMRNIHR